MRDEVDFESYAAARWHSVVHTLTLLGVPPGRAATLARRTLAGLRAGWSRREAFDDLDAELYRLTLDLQQHDDTPWWTEPAYDDELWTEIEPELDRLTGAHRRWLVLRHIAELPDSYIAAVVGEPDPGWRAGVPSEEQLREVARQVPVQAFDLGRVVEMAEQDVRTRRRRGIGVAAGLVGVVGLGSLLVLFTRPDDPADISPRELAPAEVVRTPSSSGVPWYGDGELHLERVVIQLPALVDVAAVNNGAVYTNRDRDLILLTDLGERTLLAPIGADGTFEVSDEEGLVAWLPDDENASLVVRDLASQSNLVSMDVRGAGELIAIDAGFVYFRDDRGDVELSLETGETAPIEASGRLLDVASRVRVFQITPERILAVQPLFDIEYDWPGTGAEVSDDGRLVTTWEEGVLALHDTRSGDEEVPDLGPAGRAIDAEFGSIGTITYLVQDTLSSAGTVQVRTCSFGPVFLPSGGPAPSCTQEVAGTYRGTDTDLMLAR